MANRNSPPTQRALSTPEIISEIIGWISVAKAMSPPLVVHAHGPIESRRREILNTGRLPALARCARVNRTWFNAAVRFLWEDLRFVGWKYQWEHRPFVVRCIEHCDPARRQFYANFVHRASLIPVKRPETDRTSLESDTLFLCNLPCSATEDALRDLFSEHGSIMGIHLPTDPESGCPIGYVQYSSVDEAREAHSQLQGRELEGRPLRLDFCTPRLGDGGRESLHGRWRGPGRAPYNRLGGRRKEPYYGGDRAIKHVIFPRLEWLFLDFGNGDRIRPSKEIYIPHIRCPNLKALVIHPEFGGDPEQDPLQWGTNLDQKDWDFLFDQIATLFPSLETIKIVDAAIVWPGALARFQERMPCLKTFEHSVVKETTGDPMNEETWDF